MTEISVTSTAYQVEDRSWMHTQWGQGPGENPSCVLDVSAFTANTHYPDGYIRSGQALGKITATGLMGPYDDAVSDGRQTCVGLLHSSVRVNTADLTKDPGAALVVAGFIREARLPVAIDTNGKADLKLCHFA